MAPWSLQTYYVPKKKIDVNFKSGDFLSIVLSISVIIINLQKLRLFSKLFMHLSLHISFFQSIFGSTLWLLLQLLPNSFLLFCQFIQWVEPSSIINTSIEIQVYWMAKSGRRWKMAIYESYIVWFLYSYFISMRQL